MRLTKMFVLAVLVGAVAVIGCSNDDGSGGSGGTAGAGGTAGSGGSGGIGGSAGIGGSGGMPAEGCADADVECADCEVDTPESERCLGAVVACNFLEQSECQACIESSDPARDCGGAGGTGGTGGTAGGGGMGGTPAEGCADSEVLCAECEADTSEWEICLGGVFVCNELVEPMECPACVDLLQPGSDCDGAGGAGGSGGTGGFPLPGVVCALCINEINEPECEARWNECVANPPSGNALDKCIVFALAACIEIEPG
mgnify:CR=1 FL=1